MSAVEKREEDGVKKSPRQSQDTNIFFLSDLVESGKRGNLCAKVLSVSQSLKSHSGWVYRKMRISDRSLAADLLIAESKFSSWNFRAGDHLVFSAKSNGIDNEGTLSLFLMTFWVPLTQQSFSSKRRRRSMS